MDSRNPLPLEIFLKVLELLADDKKALARCCRVSSEIQELATPILYRSIHTTSVPESERFNLRGKNQMFRRITLYPELARHAHKLREDFQFGESYPSTISDESVINASREMTSLRWASLSGGVLLGKRILGAVELYPHLVELEVRDILPQRQIWTGESTSIKTLRWTFKRDRRTIFAPRHPAATIPMLNFLFNAVEDTCPALESIDIHLLSSLFTNSEKWAYQDPVEHDHLKIFAKSDSGLASGMWALKYPQVADQDPTRPAVLKHLNHVGIFENRGVQHAPAFQDLLSTFIRNHGATMSSIAIPIGPHRTHEGLTFILSLCKRIPNLKKLALLQGRDSDGPVGTQNFMNGEAFLSALLDDLLHLQRSIERFTLIDIASPFTREFGKLLRKLKKLKHLHIGDRNNSILQGQTPKEQYESEHVKFGSYDLMSMIEELPPSLETLVLTITGSKVKLSNKEDFEAVSDLGDSIFQKLRRLRSCDIIAWFPDATMEFASELPRVAVHFRRLPFKECNPKLRTLWTSRFFDMTSFLFMGALPSIWHRPTTLSLPDNGEFAGPDAGDIWRGGPQAARDDDDGMPLRLRGATMANVLKKDMLLCPLYQKDHID